MQAMNTGGAATAKVSAITEVRITGSQFFKNMTYSLFVSSLLNCTYVSPDKRRPPVSLVGGEARQFCAFSLMGARFAR
jgi:hypothetical protein